MRVLYLCHRLPYPPKGGAKIRAFHTIRHLSKSHRVTVATLARSRAEMESGEALQDHCEKVIVEKVGSLERLFHMVIRIPSRQPSSMGYFHSRRLALRIREELRTEPYDLIVVHCSSMAPYVARYNHVPKMLDFCDMDSQKWLAYGTFKPFPLSLGYRLEGSKLQRAETELARCFDVCTCATPGELQTLTSFATGTRAEWYPNGVDLDFFRPTDEPYDPDFIAFIGRMDYFPNERCMVEFCSATLPLVRRRRPGVKLFIVGADPSRAVRQLARIEGVTVTGSVPQVQPYVLRAALTIATLGIARGVQNKILESLAMGVPCVCSDIAARGVDAVPGEHLLTARTQRETADAILRILTDPSERERLAAAGRARMVSHHSWDSAMTKLDSIIEQTLDTAPRKLLDTPY